MRNYVANITEDISYVALVSLQHHTSSWEAVKTTTAAWIYAALISKSKTNAW